MFRSGRSKKDEVAELQQHVHKLEEDAERLRQEGAQQKKTMGALEAELEDREEALEQTRGSLAHFSSLLKEGQVQEEKLQEQIAKLSEEKDTAQQKCRIESQEIQCLKDELVQCATIDAESDAQALAELQKTLQVRESCAAQLQLQNSELTSQLHRAEVGAKTSQEELQERLATLASEHCQQVAHLRSECASLARANHDQHTEAICSEEQILDIDEHAARKPALIEATGEQESSTASQRVGQPLETGRQSLSLDLTMPQADCQRLEARLVEAAADNEELQGELAKLREEMYAVEEERDDMTDRAMEAEQQLTEERRNLECAQLESNDASRERDVEMERLRESKDANTALELRLAAALQDIKDRDTILAAKEGDQRLMLMQQALEQEQERWTLFQTTHQDMLAEKRRIEEQLSREEASTLALHHEFCGAETELAESRLAMDGMEACREREEEVASYVAVLKEQFQSELSGLRSDLDLAGRRMSEEESRAQASSATLDQIAEEHATAVAAIDKHRQQSLSLEAALSKEKEQTAHAWNSREELDAEHQLLLLQSSEHASKMIALQDELQCAGDEVNAQMAASHRYNLDNENLAVQEQNIARSHANQIERLGVEVAEAKRRTNLEQTTCIGIASERDIALSQASMLEARLAALEHELNEGSAKLVAVGDDSGRCLNEALAAEQEQRALLQRAHSDLQSRLMHVEDMLATNENSAVMQSLSEELAVARATSTDANSRATRLMEELAKERSMTSQTYDESLTCSKQMEQVPRLAESKLHSLGRDAGAPDKQIWEVDRLRHELVEERRNADRLRTENAGLERDMVDLVKMLNELKAAVRQYAVSGAGVM